MSYQETSFANVDGMDRDAAADIPLPSAMTPAPADGPARVVAFPGHPVAASVTAHAVPQAPTQPLVKPDLPQSRLYRRFGKRAFDLVCVIAALPVWLPIMMVFALIVARDGHNPFYTQDRVGRGGRIFRMIKLRSMVPNADAKLEAHLEAHTEARAEWDATQKLKSDPRITRTGRLIRKTSVDELPQLLNVLTGDMSLVGPRPFMTKQAKLYHGQGYYKVRPGLTGLWQVSDRNECEFAERTHYDDTYERTLSLRSDLSILLRTASVVARGTGY